MVRGWVWYLVLLGLLFLLEIRSTLGPITAVATAFVGYVSVPPPSSLPVPSSTVGYLASSCPVSCCSASSCSSPVASSSSSSDPQFPSGVPLALVSEASTFVAELSMVVPSMAVPSVAVPSMAIALMVSVVLI